MHQSPKAEQNKGRKGFNSERKPLNEGEIVQFAASRYENAMCCLQNLRKEFF
jgi:hypothetical protein